METLAPWIDYSRIGDWIQTYSGVVLYPLDPRPEEILIEDIAHALSNTPRFTGHTKQFYSVAQHSVLVSYRVPDEMALRGLLHDASEAYINDIARPTKRMPFMHEYREIEKNLQAAIYKKFGIFGPDPEELHDADAGVLGDEALVLMAPLQHPENWKHFTDRALRTGIRALEVPYYSRQTTQTPDEAKSAFLQRFKDLVLAYAIHA